MLLEARYLRTLLFNVVGALPGLLTVIFVAVIVCSMGVVLLFELLFVMLLCKEIIIIVVALAHDRVVFA